MPRLGTYNTIDAPTEKIDEAFEFLKTEFNKIDGHVRKVLWPHDFGSYPSFEIDYPQEIEDAKNKSEDMEFSENDEDNLLWNELDNKVSDWHDKADKVEEAYGNKFSEWL